MLFVARIFYSKKGREDGATEEAELLHSSLSKVATHVTKQEWSNAAHLQDSVHKSTRALSPDCSLLFFCFMSHGQMGALVGADKIMLPINDLIEDIAKNIPDSLPLVILYNYTQDKLFD